MVAIIFTLFVLSSLFFVELATVHGGENAIHTLDAEASWFPVCSSPDGRIPRLVPHLQDCRRLFVCSNGTMTEYMCREGEVFSVKQQRCKKQAPCRKDYTNEEILAFVRCPKHSSDDRLHPHPNDCGIYYQCVHGTAYPMPCPDGLHFSVEMQRCEWPHIAKCKKGNPPSKSCCCSQWPVCGPGVQRRSQPLPVQLQLPIRGRPELPSGIWGRQWTSDGLLLRGGRGRPIPTGGVHRRRAGIPRLHHHQRAWHQQPGIR